MFITNFLIFFSEMVTVFFFFSRVGACDLGAIVNFRISRIFKVKSMLH